MKTILTAGARPNFMKIAPIWHEMRRLPDEFETAILHTGQHYDDNMSRLFFEDIEIPEPDINLGVGSGSHAEQTGRTMIELEKAFFKERPDLVLVVGDVNSTLASSIVAAKLRIPVAHVEAGLRSFDRTMPEEINRIVTDHLCDFLFTTCEDANENLRKEGIPEDKIYFVGNVMIDTLLRFKVKAEAGAKANKGKEDYAILTLHRPSNVDNKETLQGIFAALQSLSRHIPIIFPVHPRTMQKIRGSGISPNNENIRLMEPLGYLDFLRLCMNSKFVMTDSGGIQEETTYLGIPCLTLRENTERPITIREGTNVLVGRDKERIIDEGLKFINGKKRPGRIPNLWDGKAAQRIVKVLKEKL